MASSFRFWQGGIVIVLRFLSLSLSQDLHPLPRIIILLQPSEFAAIGGGGICIQNKRPALNHASASSVFNVAQEDRLYEKGHVKSDAGFISFLEFLPE